MSSNANQIVLIGATVRAAGESASRAGFRVIGADLFNDSDTKAVCDLSLPIPTTNDALDRFCQICSGIDVVCVGDFFAESGSSPSADQVFQRLSENSLVLGATVETRSTLRNFRFLRELAHSSGMKIPLTFTREDLGPEHTTSEHTTSEHTTLERHKRWLIKRQHSSGGLGVRWMNLRNSSSKTNSQSVDFKLSDDEWLQQWVAGKPMGATFLSDGDRVLLLGACRSLFTRLGSSPFVYSGSCGPVELSGLVRGKLQKLGHELVSRTRLTGLFNVDFVVDPSGEAWLLEVNPRWSGSAELIERHFLDSQRLGSNQPPPRKSLLSVAVAIMRGEVKCGSLSDLSTQSSPVGRPFLKRVVYAHRDFSFRLDGLIDLLDPGESVHDLPTSGASIEKDAPVMTYIMDQKNTGSIANYRTRLKSLRKVIEDFN